MRDADVVLPRRDDVAGPEALPRRLEGPAAQQGLGGAAQHAFEARARNVGGARGRPYHGRVGAQGVAAAAGADVERRAGDEHPFEAEPAFEGIEELRGHGFAPFFGFEYFSSRYFM